jgi:hypothetical protein
MYTGEGIVFTLNQVTLADLQVTFALPELQ